MIAQAPGKLILSGEHSVVYGAPALAVAVAEQVRVSSQSVPTGNICLNSGSGPDICLSSTDLLPLQQRLEQAYQSFLDDRADISQVLQQSSDLLFYVLSLYPPGPIHLHIDSQLPTGSGLGSSAAVIAALLKLLTADRLAPNAFMQQVRYCERLQHGRGSLLDAATVTLGGVIRVQSDTAVRLPVTLGPDWYRLDTGRPECSTGEVVEHVRQHFADSGIWREFAELTDRLQSSMHDSDRIVELVRQNHRLLQQIGVVPSEAAGLIDKIEQLGGAAKISGAGAHRGDKAGQLLLYLPDTALAELQNRYNIIPLPIRQSDRGASLATDQD